MKLLARNKIFALLSLSRFLNTLGAAIYNLVFVVFAASMPQPSLAVGIANLIVFIPSLFTIFVGMKADRTKKKANWLIRIGYLQAILFILIALMTKIPGYLAFSIVCFLNIISDCLSDYRGGLQLPIMKKNIPDEDLMEAYSFNQLLSMVCSISGQALGVWLLAISHQNFALVASINAVTFLLSSTCLLIRKKQLTHDPVIEPKSKNSLVHECQEMYQNAKSIFANEEVHHFGKLLFSLVLINALGGSISGIYNLQLLHSPFFQLSFSQSLLILEAVTILSMVWASLTPHDYFSKQSLHHILLWITGGLTMLGLTNILMHWDILSLLLITFLGYLVAKINPKVSSLLMSKLPAEKLASTSSFLGLMVSFAMPLGTALFSSLAIWSLPLAWGTFAILGFTTLLLTTK